MFSFMDVPEKSNAKLAPDDATVDTVHTTGTNETPVSVSKIKMNLNTPRDHPLTPQGLSTSQASHASHASYKSDGR